MKLFLGEYPVLCPDVLKEKQIEVVKEAKDADFVIHFSTESYGSGWQSPDDQPPIPRSKGVMIQVEPPLAAYRQLVYERKFLDQFHTAYVFNPTEDAANQFPVTQKPHLFPYYARPFDRVTRENTMLGPQRRFYYAGGRYQQWGMPNAHGSINLYPLRSQIVSYLIGEGLAHYVTGEGWKERHTRSDADWQATKLMELIRHECDFAFCLENSRCQNYISEKIHDGFNSDRVVFYLGCPNIQDFIPSNCFINLSQPPYYKVLSEMQPQPYVFSFESVRDKILGITQDEYDATLTNARKFRDEVLTEENYRLERAKLTRHMLDRLASC